jgi:hypothetical protein
LNKKETAQNHSESACSNDWVTTTLSLWLVAMDMMTTTLPHPVLMQWLAEQPQLCLVDVLALLQQRN